MKPKTCVRMAGTRTGKLRARVERKGEPHFEVTLGGEKWYSMFIDDELRQQILERARLYVDKLKHELATSNPDIGG